MNRQDLDVFMSLAGKEGITKDEIIKVKNLYEKYGIIDKAGEEAAKYIKKAESLIGSLDKELDCSELKQFTEWMLKRKF